MRQAPWMFTRPNSSPILGGCEMENHQTSFANLSKRAASVFCTNLRRPMFPPNTKASLKTKKASETKLAKCLRFQTEF
jgi:hypothetical protein